MRATRHFNGARVFIAQEQNDFTVVVEEQEEDAVDLDERVQCNG